MYWVTNKLTNDLSIFTLVVSVGYRSISVGKYLMRSVNIYMYIFVNKSSIYYRVSWRAYRRPLERCPFNFRLHRYTVRGTTYLTTILHVDVHRNKKNVAVHVIRYIFYANNQSHSYRRRSPVQVVKTNRTVHNSVSRVIVVRWHVCEHTRLRISIQKYTEFLAKNIWFSNVNTRSINSIDNIGRATKFQVQYTSANVRGGCFLGIDF